MLAFAFFRERLRHAYFIMLATMIVDLDHLLATPIFDPNRCSIGFHPLHGAIPIAIYAALCFVPRARLVGIGLSVHMILDFMDCLI